MLDNENDMCNFCMTQAVYTKTNVACNKDVPPKSTLETYYITINGAF